MDLLRKYLIRKFIPFIAVIGSFGAMSLSVQHIAYEGINIYLQSAYFIAFIIVGIVIGSLLSALYEKRGKDILTYNALGKANLFVQKIYFLAPLGIVTGYFLGREISVGFAIACCITYGLAFTGGLGVGVFDYKDIVTQKTLNLGVVPIGLSFAYAYYATQDLSYIDIAWVFGAVYLYAYLLFINRIKLNSIMFFRNSVNIEKSKSIRVYNDILVTGVMAIFLLFFNIRQVIKIGYSWLLSAFIGFFDLLAKIMDNLLTDIPPSGGEGDNFVFEQLGGEAVPVSLGVKILLYVFASLFIIGMLVVIYIGIRAVLRMLKNVLTGMSGTGNVSISRGTKTKEYEETTEIVKDKLTSDRSIRNKKYLYTIRGLEKLKNDEEKLRYLYGFALERLIKREVSIDISDTPLDVLDKVIESKGGLELSEAQFEKFTDEYRRVRYGYKAAMASDYKKQAVELEKRIGNLKPPKKID